MTQYHDGTPHTQESIDRQKQDIEKAIEKARIICENLAEKHGVSFEQELEILNTKYKKRKD